VFSSRIPGNEQFDRVAQPHLTWARKDSGRGKPPTLAF